MIDRFTYDGRAKGAYQLALSILKDKSLQETIAVKL